MLDIQKTDEFEQWFTGLRDRQAKARVQARIDRMQLGHFGDTRPVGGGVSEMRIFHGPGYRVYFTRVGDRVIFLLRGGDKSAQSQDIARGQETGFGTGGIGHGHQNDALGLGGLPEDR